MTPRTVALDAMLPRFDRVERVVHWCTATLVLDPAGDGLQSLRRAAVDAGRAARPGEARSTCTRACCCRFRCCSRIALRAGASCAPTSAGSTVGRATTARGGRAAGARPAQLGKFNPGQKLNATFIGAAMVVMLMTGSIMRWFEPFSDSWRQGATFVHDWFAIGLLVRDRRAHPLRVPRSRRAQRHGARLGAARAGRSRDRPRWYAEVVRSSGIAASARARRATLVHASHEHGREASGARRRGARRRSGGRWRRGWRRRARAVARAAPRGRASCTHRGRDVDLADPAAARDTC